MSGDAFPLAPLTDEGIRAELEDAWDDLAAWAKVVGRYGITAHSQAQARRATARHDAALEAVRVRFP